uniref:Uncharacterized protein n=1 Tax=Timema douglasi TaxID=61478 RepID=A0A7R8VGS6_TIMDO|nr:unnamed protein product [Timema douglasi]
MSIRELAQNPSPESDSEEDKPSRTFTTKSMATAFHRIQEGLQMLADEDPDVEHSLNNFYSSITKGLGRLCSKEVHPHLHKGSVENEFGKTTLIMPDWDSNLDLPSISSLVCCKSSALDQAATEAGKPYKGQVKSSESSIGSGWYSVGCSDVSVVDVKVGGVRWATHFWLVWSGAVSYCGPVQTRKPGMVLRITKQDYYHIKRHLTQTVFSRRREELQHSSCSTSRISRSVSTLKHCPWPWMGPPKNKASNCRKRCSPGTSVHIHTSASLETAATESCCGAGLATGSDIEGHYNMAHLQEIPLLLRSDAVKYPTLHSTTIPGDNIFHLVEKWHLVTRIKPGRNKAWLRSGLVKIVRPSALGIQVHLKVASVGLKESLHIIKAVEETI